METICEKSPVCRIIRQTGLFVVADVFNAAREQNFYERCAPKKEQNVKNAGKSRLRAKIDENRVDSVTMNRIQL